MSGYGRLDRLAHRLAFAGPRVQLAAADIDETVSGRAAAGLDLKPPVFVTSLPRAGTTALLTALSQVPGMATQTYRDMPFVMAPMLWARLSGGFRRSAAPRERAHGDGVAVGFDSPEAFEEVAWRRLWPGHYGEDRIALWTAADRDAEAEATLARLFRRVVALRLGARAGGGRYLSKNNANIARLDLIPEIFPGAEILVPVRDPLAQAASLRRQHRRFAEIHAADPFARRYMADIGHYEFGALHRPIAFPGFAGLAEGLGPEHLDYWLACWIAAFEHVEARRGRVRLLDYAALCAPEGEAAAALAGALGLGEAAGPAIAAHFRPPPPVPEDAAGHGGPLRDRAEALFARLLGPHAGS